MYTSKPEVLIRQCLKQNYWYFLTYTKTPLEATMRVTSSLNLLYTVAILLLIFDWNLYLHQVDRSKFTNGPTAETDRISSVANFITAYEETR